MKQDTHGRKMNYLRLSITDRCNLRCVYCRSGQWKNIPHADILHYEEFLQLIEITHELGIIKVRLTGGEPFVRKGFMNFLTTAKTRFPNIDFRITTNGTLLEPHIEKLAQIGISTINLSLDTRNKELFSSITGRNFFDTVQNNIEKCIQADIKVKINVVAMKGVNDNELPEFVQLAQNLPIELRFIEFMPMGMNSIWSETKFWSINDIKNSISKLTKLTPLIRTDEAPGPAQLYSLKRGLGTIGFISSISNHFCLTCNRIRITADGKLRPCLFSDKEYDLIPFLRTEIYDKQALKQFIESISSEKPIGNELLLKRNNVAVCEKGMSSIGG